MRKELVIAAYERNYSWAKYTNDNVRVTPYRKGQKTECEKEIFLENNVGQDVHTFFYHIVKNYDKLADFTFFSQDYPFDHVSNYLDIINGDPKFWNMVCRVSDDGYWAFSTGTALRWEPHMPKEAYTGNTLICDSSGAPHHTPSVLNVNTLWKKIFECEPPLKYEFVPAGHFCVTKEKVRIRPKEFYENIVQLLESDRSNCPYEVERIESYIFNKQYV